MFLKELDLMTQSTYPCPCGLAVPYLECCGLYLDRAAKPETPEALMRSRFTAYTMARIDYIKQTMRARAAYGYDEKSALHWAKSVHWLDLTVVRSYLEDNKTGFVEFIARFLDKNAIKTIHELSEFNTLEGSWYYVDGKTIEDAPIPIARNALCPCGSKRKFKNCHVVVKIRE